MLSVLRHEQTKEALAQRAFPPHTCSLKEVCKALYRGGGVCCSQWRVLTRIPETCFIIHGRNVATSFSIFLFFLLLFQEAKAQPTMTSHVSTLMVEYHVNVWILKRFKVWLFVSPWTRPGKNVTYIKHQKLKNDLCRFSFLAERADCVKQTNKKHFKNDPWCKLAVRLASSSHAGNGTTMWASRKIVEEERWFLRVIIPYYCNIRVPWLKRFFLFQRSFFLKIIIREKKTTGAKGAR